MGQPFHEALKEVRWSSHYPRQCDFIRASGIQPRTYWRYEHGELLPQLSFLERIIFNCGLSDQAAKKLREVHAMAVARKLGVELQQLPADFNVSKLAERIQHEVEYELKRARLHVMGRTRQVCIRRIEMLLKDALRIP